MREELAKPRSTERLERLILYWESESRRMHGYNSRPQRSKIWPECIKRELNMTRRGFVIGKEADHIG